MSSVRFLDRSPEPRLAWSLDKPNGPAAGKVLLFHGYADHSGRFDHVTRMWNERGLVVGRFDLRGHGRSEGARGHVMAVEEYVRDARDALGALEKEPAWTEAPGKPILFGHSLGALVASEVAFAMGGSIGGFACTSPFFGIKRPVSFIELAAAKAARRFWPTFRQSSGLSGTDMTHNPDVAKGYDKDPFHFGHVTVGWFFAVMEAQSKVLDRAGELVDPFFCIAAGDDRVVSTEAARLFYSRAGSHEKELDVRPGLFHELLNEPDWRDHASRLAERMLRWSAA
jgi:alpha-beta hydrolase superfamily lysophospholipase